MPLRSVLLALVLVACVERTDAEAPSLRALERPGLATPVSLTVAVPSDGLLPPVAAPAPSAAVEPAPPAAEARVVLAAGGDVNFGRECGQAILKDIGYDPFSGLGEAWTSADVRFVNLESQLSDQNGVTQNPGNRLIFTGPPGGADVLARARVSVVSTANNHAWDYGKSAFFETMDNLDRAGVLFAGSGRDVDAAYRPAVLHVKGHSLALFAVTHIWNNGVFHGHEGQKYVAWADVGKLRAGVERARREHDFVLVSYHGGEEYVHAPVDKTRRFVAAMMALGVDAVIGHHPHVPHGVGFKDGRPVLYSLGNFVFAGHDNRPWTKQSFFARLTLQKGALPVLEACPIAIDGHRPRSYAPVREALAIERFRLHLIGTSTSVGGADVSSADAQGCLRVTPLPPKPGK